MKTENSCNPLVVPPNDSINPSNSPVENEDATEIAEDRDESLGRLGSKSAYSWCHHLLRIYKNAGERTRMEVAP
jgi:hypothetical protein